MAARQDWTLVRRILDYRSAQYAMDCLNEGESGIERLQSRPELGELLSAMHAAQNVETHEEVDSGERR